MESFRKRKHNTLSLNQKIQILMAEFVCFYKMSAIIFRSAALGGLVRVYLLYLNEKILLSQSDETWSIERGAGKLSMCIFTVESASDVYHELICRIAFSKRSAEEISNGFNPLQYITINTDN